MGKNTFRVKVAGLTETASITVNQTPIDIYIDSQTGHRFEEIKSNTDIYRILNFFDYQDILEEFPKSINSAEAIKKLKEMSQEVTFDDTFIQTLMQKTQNNSRRTEYQVYIVLKRNWIDPIESPAIVTAEEDMHTKQSDRKNGRINMDISSTGGKSGKMYHKSPNNQIVLAQVHGHNKEQRERRTNLEGTSPIDATTAKFSGFNIYSLRAYEAEVGGQAIIDKVDGKGIPSLALGATRGNPNISITDRKPIFDIGKDALDYWSSNFITWEEYKKKLDKN